MSVRRLSMVFMIFALLTSANLLKNSVTYPDLSDDTLDDLSQTSLADPNADQIVFWDDSDGAYEFLVPNTGIEVSGNNLNVTVTDTTLTEEQVEDFAGSLLGGTETRITVTYDDANNLTSVVDPLQRETLYEYDGLNRLEFLRLPVVDPLGAPGGRPYGLRPPTSPTSSTASCPPPRGRTEPWPERGWVRSRAAGASGWTGHTRRS